MGKSRHKTAVSLEGRELCGYFFSFESNYVVQVLSTILMDDVESNKLNMKMIAP